METLSAIKKAIREQRVISFTYNKSGEAPGTRFGNPHSVFRVSGKSGRVSTKAHIVQTGGASNGGKVSANANFIVFDLRYMNDVQVKTSQDPFKVDPRYNPNLRTCHNAIQQV